MNSNNQLSLEETLEQIRNLLTGINPALYPHVVRLVETHIQLVKAVDHKKEGPG